MHRGDMGMDVSGCVSGQYVLWTCIKIHSINNKKLNGKKINAENWTNSLSLGKDKLIGYLLSNS